jgi:hypothetical protein
MTAPKSILDPVARFLVPAKVTIIKSPDWCYKELNNQACQSADKEAPTADRTVTLRAG